MYMYDTIVIYVYVWHVRDQTIVNFILKFLAEIAYVKPVFL